MKRISRALYIVLAFAILLVGCSGNNNADSQISESTEMNYEGNISSHSESTSEEADQNTTNKVAENSEVRICNAIKDGTLWLIEEDAQGQEYVVRANVFGNILAKALCDEFDGYFTVGIDERLFFTSSGNIYDIYSLEDVTSTYKGEYDEIVSYLTTENGPVFVVRKVTDSFEEQYTSLGLVDKNGKMFFDISLDHNSMHTQYGIESNYSTDEITAEYAGNNVYYIKYVGSQYESGALNSLIIDLSRDKIIPCDFPKSCWYCSSDGYYTLICSTSVSDFFVVNNDTEAFSYYPNSDFRPEGTIAEGLFYGIGSRYGNDNEQAYLDASGNIIINLNNYPQAVKQAWQFKNGTALIEFENEYVAFIDNTGAFLFDPVKGCYANYFESEGVAVVTVEDESGTVQHFSVDKNGNVREINIFDGLSNEQFHLVEYEGKKYWVVGGDSGLQMQVYE